MDHFPEIQELSYFTLKQSTEPFFWIDREGTIHHVNPAALELSKLKYEELIGTKIYDLNPDENEDIWKQRWQRLQKEKQIVFEKKQPRGDGKTLHLEIHQNLIEFEGKAYTVSLVKDKTEEYAIRDRLIESERRLSTLMGNLPGMAYRCMFDENWTMKFVSQGCRKLTGYQPEELINNSIISYQELIQAGDRESVWNRVRDNLKKHEAFQIQYRITTALQETKWVWEQGIGVENEQDVIVAIEGFITDITDIKETEKKLVEKEQQVRQLKDKLEKESIYLKEEIKLQANFEEIITSSNRFRNVLKNIEQVAHTDSTVLILGETGTGKELIARAIHNNSNRSDRPLIKVNCAALPSELIESELFGHEKGAFTGAYNKKAGKFELAHKGTIFLDEIGELPVQLQVKLLRVLQEGEFERLGNPKTMKADVRVIAATNRELEKAVDKGEFREDLYYRLNVFPIHVPPLRERKEDIPFLVRFFIKKYGAKTGRKITETSEKVMKSLMDYDWPGNVRELENIIERAVILCASNRLMPGTWLPDKKKVLDNTLMTLEDNERQHIIKALKATKGRISGENGAAQLLAIKRTTLEARMKKLGISRHPYMSK